MVSPHEYWADDIYSGRKPTNQANGFGHVLKQRMQWRLTHLPELVEKLRGLVKEQMNEADRALIGVEDVHLRSEYAKLSTHV